MDSSLATCGPWIRAARTRPRPYEPAAHSLWYWTVSSVIFLSERGL